MQKCGLVSCKARLSICLVGLFAFLMAGCGGGSSSSVANTAPFPVNGPITTFNATSLSITLTGTYGNTSLSLVATDIKGASNQTFLGQVADTSNATTSLSENGMFVSSSSTTYYYSVNPYKSLGSISPGNYTVYANQEVLPTTATIGMAGNLDTGTDYSDSTQSTILDTFVDTWSLVAGPTPSTAYLCNTTVTQAVASIATSGTSTTCLNIDINGNILGVKLTQSEAGQSITLLSSSIVTLPSAPTISTVTAGAGSATVNFTPPANDGGAAITSYTVTAIPDGPTVAGIITTTGAASPITINYLTGGTGYTFTVAATNSLGIGSDSVASYSVTPTVGPAFYVVSTFAGSGVAGSTNGSGTAASFFRPTSVAVDSTGNVYVADSGNNEIRIITPAGVVSTLAGSSTQTGNLNGPGMSALFDRPVGVAVDSSGNVYVADYFNYLVRKITPAGVVSTFAGPIVGDTPPAFYQPQGVAVDSSGNVYLADTNNNAIRIITPAGVASTLAGGAGSGSQGSTNGTGTAALFAFPTGVAVDNSGNVFVADSSNQEIRMITPMGVVSTLAGTAGVSGRADGTGVAATFMSPWGVATDSAGNVYVADAYGHEIRMITPAGVVTTLAGSSAVGSTNGIGTAASFYNPTGVAVDSSGNVYVADEFNNVIRKLTLVP